MKRLLSVLTVIALLMSVSGCGNDEKVIAGNRQSVETDVTQSGEMRNEQEDNVRKEMGDYIGYVFFVKGTAVEVDADITPVLDALGKELSYYEAASCAFEGLDKMYTYSGFEIDTYPNGNCDCVSAIILKDDSVATAEGVSIGDSKEKLEQVYGSGTEEGNMIVYTKDEMKLCFILKNNEIVSIEYRSKVLEV